MSPSARLDAEVSSGRRIRDYISQSRSKNPYGHLQFRNLDEQELMWYMGLKVSGKPVHTDVRAGENTGQISHIKENQATLVLKS